MAFQTTAAKGLQYLPGCPTWRNLTHKVSRSWRGPETGLPDPAGCRMPWWLPRLSKNDGNDQRHTHNLKGLQQYGLSAQKTTGVMNRVLLQLEFATSPLYKAIFFPITLTKFDLYTYLRKAPWLANHWTFIIHLHYLSNGKKTGWLDYIVY